MDSLDTSPKCFANLDEFIQFMSKQSRFRNVRGILLFNQVGHPVVQAVLQTPLLPQTPPVPQTLTPQTPPFPPTPVPQPNPLQKFVNDLALKDFQVLVVTRTFTRQLIQEKIELEEIDKGLEEELREQQFEEFAQEAVKLQEEELQNILEYEDDLKDDLNLSDIYGDFRIEELQKMATESEEQEQAQRLDKVLQERRQRLYE
jgi:hypothetical protein